VVPANYAMGMDGAGNIAPTANEAIRMIDGSAITDVKVASLAGNPGIRVPGRRS